MSTPKLLIQFEIIMLISFFNLVTYNLNAQCVFQKLYRYGSTGNDYGNAVICLKDGNYITVGSTIFSTSSDGVFIVKTNEFGDTLWQRAFDNSSQGGDPGLSVLELNDNAIVVCGWSFDPVEYARDTYLFKIGQNGDSIWFKTIDCGYNDFGIMHKQTHDGGFIIGGHYYDSTLTYSNVFLTKTDSLGNKLWQKNYPDTNHNNEFMSFDFSSDGGYIIGGDFQNPVTSSWDLFLLKTDSLGNQQWKKYYGTSYSERKGYAISTLDSGFAIVGYTTYANGDIDGYIVKTDSIGTVKWEKKYGLALYTDVFKVIRQLPDSNYIVAGSIVDTNFTSLPPQVRFFKLNQNGDSVWTRKYSYYGFHGPYAANSHTYVEDLDLTSDGGFIATGYIINNSLPAKNDLWLLKTDSLGNTCTIDTTTYAGCWEYNCSLTHSSIAVSSDTLYLSQGATAQFTAVSNYATEWNWNFGDNSTSSTENPQHSYTATGSYTVTLIAGNGICTDTSYYTITVKLNSGITTIYKIAINLFPNPASDNVTLEYNLKDCSESKVEIYDILGYKVFESKLIENEIKMDISTKALNSGVYHLVIKCNGETLYKTQIVIIK